MITQEQFHNLNARIDDVFKKAQMYGLTWNKVIWRENTYDSNKVHIKSYARWICYTKIPQLLSDPSLTGKERHLILRRYQYEFWRSEWAVEYILERIERNRTGRRGGSRGTIWNIVEAFQIFKRFADAFLEGNHVKMGDAREIEDMLEEADIGQGNNASHGIIPSDYQLQLVYDTLLQRDHKYQQQILDMYKLIAGTGLRLGSVFRIESEHITEITNQYLLQLGFTHYLYIPADKGNRPRKILVRSAPAEILVAYSKKNKKYLFTFGNHQSQGDNMTIFEKVVEWASQKAGITHRDPETRVILKSFNPHSLRKYYVNAEFEIAKHYSRYTLDYLMSHLIRIQVSKLDRSLIISKIRNEKREVMIEANRRIEKRNAQNKIKNQDQKQKDWIPMQPYVTKPAPHTMNRLVKFYITTQIGHGRSKIIYSYLSAKNKSRAH